MQNLQMFLKDNWIPTNSEKGVGEISIKTFLAVVSGTRYMREASVEPLGAAYCH
jgi:hypothetical protein